MPRPTLIAVLAALALSLPRRHGLGRPSTSSCSYAADVDAVVKSTSICTAPTFPPLLPALRGYTAQLTHEAVADVRADARVLFVSESATVQTASNCDPKPSSACRRASTGSMPISTARRPATGKGQST